MGRTGRITSAGAIPPGGKELGEVMVDGAAYYALATETAVGIPAHCQVLVVDVHHPRTLVVTPF